MPNPKQPRSRLFPEHVRLFIGATYGITW